MREIGRYDKELGRVVWFKPDEDKGTTKPKRHFGATGWATGLESDAASCHSSQSEEFNDNAKRAGITGVHFDHNGQCTFSSRQQRAKYLKFRGIHDKDGGYSDG